MEAGHSMISLLWHSNCLFNQLAVLKEHQCFYGKPDPFPMGMSSNKLKWAAGGRKGVKRRGDIKKKLRNNRNCSFWIGVSPVISEQLGISRSCWLFNCCRAKTFLSALVKYLFWFLFWFLNYTWTAVRIIVIVTIDDPHFNRLWVPFFFLCLFIFRDFYS